MQHARSTLQKISREFVRGEAADGPLLAWPLACGGKIAALTSALSFADGVLTVAVPGEAWRQQLQSFVPQYLAALNRICSEPVTRIDFRLTPRR
jgi:predicted nucleic acid-binding Zn ribbon protein